MENKYEAQEKYRSKLKDEVLLHYGGVCAYCGFSDKRFLTIDHINGVDKKERKNERAGYGLYLRLRRDNFPKGFQVLCFHCNTKKQ